MLRLTSEYALRAVVYLAQHEANSPVSGRTIAQGADIPRKYLSVVLSELVRAEVLESFSGRTGGFRMCRTPKKTYLAEVVAPFEEFDEHRCPFGNPECSDENPCLAHEQWKTILEARQRFLTKTTVADVAIHPPPRAGRAVAAGRERPFAEGRPDHYNPPGFS